MAATITKVPQKAIYGLSLTRATGGSRNLIAKWSNPKALSDSDNEARATGFYVHFTFYCTSIKTSDSVTLKYERTSEGNTRTEWTLYLNGFACTDGKTYDRRVDFWPVDGASYYLKSVKVSVCPYNTKGSSKLWTSATYTFEKPRTPSVAKLEMDESTGRILCTVTADRGEDYREAWNTDVWIGIKDSRTGEYVSEYRNTFPNTTETWSYNYLDAYGRMGINANDYLMAICRAWTRGLRGSSEKAEKKLYISFPKVPEIQDVTFSSKDDDGRAKFWIKTNYSEEHPVTGIKLQALLDSDYTVESQIPGSAWVSAEDLAEDNAHCTALSTMVSNLRSAPGKHTWVRLMSWNMFEGMFYRFSAARRLDELFAEAASAAKDEVVIASATPSGSDSIDMVLAFADDGDDGTEVSWSDDVDAWRSTKDPETYEVTWDEGTPVTVGTKTYARSSELHVRGLTEGTTYYLRARRYLDGDSGRSYGPYDRDTGFWQCTPVSAPSSVTLVAPSFVARGSDVALSWTYEGGATQVEWELLTGETVTVTEQSTETGVHDRQYTYIRGDTDPDYQLVVVDGGNDARGSCVLSWERLEKLLEGSNSIALAVRVGTGGALVCSEAVTIIVAEAPSLTVEAQTVTVRPMTIGLFCSVPAEVAVTVESLGVSGGTPAGIREQAEGDAVWSDAWMPSWTAVTEQQTVNGSTTTVLVGYECDVDVPVTAELWDGGSYRIRAIATDPDTAMESDEATCEVDVTYTRKAPEPPAGVTVTPFDTTDADTGLRSIGCTVVLPSSQSLASGDVYDLYRVTPDGTQLCAEGIAPGTTMVDQFAPFGGEGLAYRVAVRTANGCVEWKDYAYVLPCQILRLDWDGFAYTYVELPYNLSLSSQWSKPFERRRHWGGSVEGYWDEGVERDEGITTNIARIGDPETARAVRCELATYCGPVLVRTPDGRCYDANVDVPDFGLSYNDGLVAISLDSRGIDLTEAHMASPAPPDPVVNPDPDPDA